MKLITILLALFITTACADELPNPLLTPGAARDVDVTTLCTTSTKLVRHTSAATKREVYSEYATIQNRDPKCTGPSHVCFEIDHLIALEMGGADVKENLWPQEYEVIPDDPSWQRNGAHKKDSLENELHKLICNGTMDMKDAQACIANNWVECYAKILEKDPLFSRK